MAKRKKIKRAAVKSRPGKRLDRNNAIASLILNIIIPGAGTLVAGMTNIGILQLLLYGVGAFMVMSFYGAIVGIPLVIIVWVWALVTGIKLVMRSR
jgi:TM2 domain-containing membrane protein YozV